MLVLISCLAAVTAVRFPATDPRIRVVGRTVTDGSALLFDWSSVYIEAQATGPLSFVVTEGWDHGNEYYISINGSAGMPIRQLNTSQEIQTYLILSEGQSGVVRIEKVTEARTDEGGVVRFIGFEAKALGAKPPSHSRRIECIGDSIMCGAHAERFSPFQTDCPSTRGTKETRESSRLSWCPTVARALSADYHVECESGNGLVATDGDTCKIFNGSEICMPEKWKHSLDCNTMGPGPSAKDPHGRGCPGGENSSIATSFEPDAVLINLGQNDYGRPAHIDPKTGKPVKNHLPPTELWVQNYQWFIANITAKAARPPQIFLACGGMADKYCNDTKATVAHMNAIGHHNVHYIDLTPASADKDPKYMGCANHPSWIAHRAMADIATPLVKGVMGWG
jgi:hypothetical protein